MLRNARYSFFFLIVGSVLSPVFLYGQAPTRVSPPLQDAYYAWDAGDYPEALRGYLDILRGSQGPAMYREVALLTGELFQVDELEPDGAGLQMDPGGRYVAYTVQTAFGTATRLLDWSQGSEPVLELDGEISALSSGALVRFEAPDSPELLQALTEQEEARLAGDQLAYFSALAQVRWLTAASARMYVHALPEGAPQEIELGGVIPGDLTMTPDGGAIYMVGGVADGMGTRLYRMQAPDYAPEAVGSVEGYFAGPQVTPDQGFVVLTQVPNNPVPRPPEAEAGPRLDPAVFVVEVATGRDWAFPGAQAAVSADGSTVAFLAPLPGGASLRVLRLDAASLDEAAADGAVGELIRTAGALANPTLSPDGAWVAYQRMPNLDWEVMAMRTDGSVVHGPLGPTGPGQGPEAEVNLSREIQHDVFPVFLDDSRVFAVKGEARHRRSYVYDLESLSVTKVFHNNTIRTIAPEYEWAATPDGSKLFVVSERDGDTVSPERGLYMVHLDREVTLEQVVARLEENLEAESDLRARGEEIFGPSAGRIRPVTEAVSEARIYGYAKVLFDFGSKHITHPGNALAIDYLTETLREWGYEPELQWFEPQPGVRTANVIARLQGTVDPDLVYVISSHFDSHQRGPGADDDTSATTALLEVARVLRDHPQPATIEFAFFTGEESGLLGSREYVRLALEGEKRIVGALNNDMVGWANDHRLDNTIRYSNPGIRDIQHAAAIQFSDLITYDALYYKNTDAHAYYEVYGDIVGGIGSYPVLGNPNYHQVTDLLETVNHRLVAEVARTSAATLMALASSPARLGPLQASLVGGQALEISWDASPETGVTAYRVRYRNPGEEWQEVRVGQPSVVLEGLQEGAEVRVKALGADGTEGWDWSRAVLTR